MVKSYYIYGCSVYYIYGQILLHLWFVDLLHLGLKVITFMVSITFMVNFYYIYGMVGITFMVFITFMGDTGPTFYCRRYSYLMRWAGSGNITNRLLKSFAREVTPLVYDINSQSLREGYVPSPLKSSIVLHINKVSPPG